MEISDQWRSTRVDFGKAFGLGRWFVAWSGAVLGMETLIRSLITRKPMSAIEPRSPPNSRNRAGGSRSFRKSRNLSQPSLGGLGSALRSLCDPRSLGVLPKS